MGTLHRQVFARPSGGSRLPSTEKKFLIGATCLVLLLILFALFAEYAFGAGKTYSFGVVPQFEQRKLYAIWKPIVEDLEKRTGLSFELVTTLKIQDFEKAIARGDFDLIYVNPYHIVQAYADQGYMPLVADKAPLRGVLVVRGDGPIQKPEDLEGKIVAFPSPNAIGASLLMRADLDQIFHVSVTPLYVKTHSSVYLHVAQGLQRQAAE